MRTNIVIDDQLMAEALKASGYETKKEAVEQGLRLLVQLSKQQEIRKLRGKIKWEGDWAKCELPDDPGRHQRLDRLFQWGRQPAN